MIRRNPTTWAKRLSGATCAVGLSAAIFGAQGCLDRPVVPITPGSAGVGAQKIRVARIDKLDMLLVVDNSSSMADKQSELGRRIPELVFALTDSTPDAKTGKANNVLDMHIGVISSSLGSHGTSACGTDLSRDNDDQGHLLPRSGEGGGSGYVYNKATGAPEAAACPTAVTASALTWVFDPAKDPAAMFKGDAGATQLQTATSCVVQSVNQNGCGYEATLESMYHFLVDPAPYASAKAECVGGATGDACKGGIVVSGLDEEVLKQREAFLRPDSLLAVLFLTDENDFSLHPAGQNWLPWALGKGGMQRGWAACENVPDDVEPDDFNVLKTTYNCASCFQDNKDPNCAKPWAADPLNNDVDGRNLRGFHQVQRFGFNFLYGRDRYVNAFKLSQVPGSDGKMGANPVFKGGFRTSDLIVVAGILGVPKTLVSNDDGSAKTLTEDDWQKIIGPVEKRDPHMIESIAPRAGIPKFAGDRAVDPVNGGDRDVKDGDDLQYACIAPRAPDATGGTDCADADAKTTNPLCDDKDNQRYFKAYPGLRTLRVIHDLGPSGFVASICNDSFRPAIQGITDKLKAALNAQCLKFDVPQKEDKSANCLIFESMKEDTQVGKKCEEIGGGQPLCTPGAEPCRVAGSDYPPLSPEEAAAQLTLSITVINADGTAQSVPTQAQAEGGSVFVTGSDGRKHLVCEIKQLAGGRVDQTVTDSCVGDPAYTPTDVGGWCYSKDPNVLGETCVKLGAPGTIRFIGDAEPRNQSEVFTLCAQ